MDPLRMCHRWQLGAKSCHRWHPRALQQSFPTVFQGEGLADTRDTPPSHVRRALASPPRRCRGAGLRWGTDTGR